MNLFRLKKETPEAAEAFLKSAEKGLEVAKANLVTVKERSENLVANEAARNYKSGSSVVISMPVAMQKKLRKAEEDVRSCEAVLAKALAEKDRIDVVHTEEQKKLKAAKAAENLKAMRSKAHMVDEALRLLVVELKDMKGLMEEAEQICSYGDKQQVKKARKMIHFVVIRGLIEHTPYMQQPPVMVFKSNPDFKNLMQHIPKGEEA